MDLKKKQLDDRIRKALVSLKVEKSNILSSSVRFCHIFLGNIDKRLKIDCFLASNSPGKLTLPLNFNPQSATFPQGTFICLPQAQTFSLIYSRRY